MADVVFLRGLSVPCAIGVEPRERRVARPLLIDLEVEVDCRPAAALDDLSQGVDYEKLAATVARVAAAREYRLVETLGEAVSAELLAAFPSITSVHLTISKTGAVAGAAAVGVVIHRRRPEAQ